jgi:hypothetical protein
MAAARSTRLGTLPPSRCLLVSWPNGSRPRLVRIKLPGARLVSSPSLARTVPEGQEPKTNAQAILSAPILRILLSR